MGGWYRDPDGRIPENDYPASLDELARAGRWLLIAIAVGVTLWSLCGWIAISLFTRWFVS